MLWNKRTPYHLKVPLKTKTEFESRKKLFLGMPKCTSKFYSFYKFAHLRTVASLMYREIMTLLY
jgi:hypothetical protein